MKIQTGIPKKNGVYVTYIELHDEIKYKYPDKILLTYINGVWNYPRSDQFFRGNVLGWIGPLPSPTIDELNKTVVKYAIGNDLTKESFHTGPFDTLQQALNECGCNGDYLFKLFMNKKSKPIYKATTKGWERVRFRRRKR